jgi:hypothetical protein
VNSAAQWFASWQFLRARRLRRYRDPKTHDEKKLNLKTAVESGRLAEPVAALRFVALFDAPTGAPSQKPREKKALLPQHVLAILPLQLPFLGLPNFIFRGAFVFFCG